jgi:hypothetical protein
LVLRVSMAAQAQRIRNIDNSDAKLLTNQNADRVQTDVLSVDVQNDRRLQSITNASVQVALSRLTTDMGSTNGGVFALSADVQNDKRLQETTNASVQVALLQLTTELENTNRALALLTAAVTNTGETSTRADMNTSRWVARVDKRVNFIKTEIYNGANVPPAQLDTNLRLLFALKPNPIVETLGLYSILMGDGASNIALAHYALSLWVVDELIDRGVDTDWLPPVVSESMPPATDGTDNHTIQMNIQMHTSARIQAGTIDWTLKLSQAAASISVHLSHTLMDLYSVQDSSVSIQ